MIHDQVKQLLALSAQADRLSALRGRRRITEAEYNRGLEELRHQCHYQAVEFLEILKVSQTERTRTLAQLIDPVVEHEFVI